MLGGVGITAPCHVSVTADRHVINMKGLVGCDIVERVDGKLILSEGIKILDMKATSGS